MKYPAILTRINRVFAYISGGIVLWASCLAVMESLARKIFLSPTSWSLNLTSAIFIWAAFLGSAWAFQELGHVSIDLVRDLVERKSKSKLRMPRRVMSLIGYGISLLVVVILLYAGWLLCVSDIELNRFAQYTFPWPLVLSHAAIVVGSGLMAVTVVFIILDLIKGEDKYI